MRVRSVLREEVWAKSDLKAAARLNFDNGWVAAHLRYKPSLGGVELCRGAAHKDHLPPAERMDRADALPIPSLPLKMSVVMPSRVEAGAVEGKVGAMVRLNGA